MQSHSTIAGIEAAPAKLFRELSKLARLAGEVLDASAALLLRVQDLVREGIEDGCGVSTSLSVLQQRLAADTALSDAPPVSLDELSAATAAARQLMLRSAETVLRVRLLIGRETVAERYRWRDKPSDLTMIQLHSRLDELVKWVAQAVVSFPFAQHEIQAMQRGFLTMRNVAHHHLSLADDARQTAEMLQSQATRFARAMEAA